jgi:hypothetical protein
VLDSDNGPIKTGYRVIPISVTLVDADAKTLAREAPSSTAMATFDETVAIQPLKIQDDETPETYKKAKVKGTFLNLAPKGSDEAIMGTGRSAEISLGIERSDGSGGAGCGGARINAGEGFTAADPSKGKFCTTGGASCRTDDQCCSRTCIKSDDVFAGKCARQ